MSKKRIVLYAIIICSVVVIYFNWQIPYRISMQNVKEIYCMYWLQGTEQRIDVSDADKQMIISEVKRLKNSGTEGQAGTMGYKFIIELNDGTQFSFVENTESVVDIWRNKGKFSRKITAPKTAEFIQRFIKEHNIEWVRT